MTTIGIDLGTTNSAVAWYNGQSVDVIELPSGDRTLPSVVCALENGSFLVGAHAKKRIVRNNPKYTFSNIKRHIGQAFTEGEHYGSQIAPDDYGKRAFIGPDGLLTPEELSAEILKTLKAAAEKRIGKKVKKVVLTYPAYFDNNRKEDTKKAAHLAGFKEVALLTEPEAAAIAFGTNRETYARVLVFDLGGGTFDVVAMEAGRGRLNVLDKNGDDDLGGADWDRALREELIARYLSDRGIDLADKPLSLLKLEPVVEEAKKDLSEFDETTVQLENVVFDSATGFDPDINYEVSRTQFEDLTKHYVDDVMQIAKETLDELDLSPRDFKEVLLVGGMTRVPAVREAVISMFGKKRVRDDVNADLAVVRGAAMEAALQDGRLPDTLYRNEISPRTIGIEIEHGIYRHILPRGTAYGEGREVEVTVTAPEQDFIPIAVLEGDGETPVDNALLGRVDVPVHPNSDPTIRLDFLLDTDGQVIVTAKDQNTKDVYSIVEPD